MLILIVGMFKKTGDDSKKKYTTIWMCQVDLQYCLNNIVIIAHLFYGNSLVG